MSDRSKTVLEVQADVSNIMSKLAMVDKELTQMADQAHHGTQKIGAGFTTAGQQAVAGSKLMANGSNQAMTAVTGLNWAVSDMPYFFQNTRMGIMAVSNNITPLVQNMAYLQKTTGSLKGALSAMGSVFTGPMGIVFAITAGIAIIQSLSFALAKQKQKAEDAAGANEEYRKSIEQINKSIDIDVLNAQIENSVKIVEATDQVVKNKEADLEAEKKLLEQAKIKYGREDQLIQQQSTLKIMAMNAATEAERISYEQQAKAMDKQIEKAREGKDKLEEEVKTRKANVKEIENELSTAEELRASQTKIQEKVNERIKLLTQIGAESKKESEYKQKVLEFDISKLKVNEQAAEWEKVKEELLANTNIEEQKTVEFKEKILELDRKIYNLSKQEKESDPVLEAAQKAAEASKTSYEKLKSEYDLFLEGIDSSSEDYLNKQIARIETEIQKTSEGTVERANLEKQLDDYNSELIQGRMDRTKAMLDYELEYQRKLAGVISDGSIEDIYEQMFSNIKQKVIQFWLDKLSITKAMMQMEEAITLLGEGKIQAFLDILFPKRIAQREAEAIAAGKSAAIKSVDSASGIPFPGNIAAIGLSLYSVFSSLRNAKTTGSQIVAAAEGLVVNKPTLALVGEAFNRSGPEIIMPENNFNRYMEKQIIPGILSKVGGDNSGLKNELKELRDAIYSIGRQIPIETGKAVKRYMKGKF